MDSSTETSKQTEELPNNYLGDSCTREELHSFVSEAYEKDCMNLEEAVYQFKQSNIQIKDKFVDSATGKENSRVDELNVGLRKLLKDKSTAYSEMVEEFAGFGNRDFGRAVWKAYCSKNAKNETQKVQDDIMSWVDGKYESVQELNQAVSNFSDFQQSVLEEAYEKDFQLPLLRGIGFESAAKYSPQIATSSYDSYSEARNAVLTQIESEGGLHIERPRRDSWTDHTATAAEFAAYWSREDSGIILGNRVRPEDITLASMTTPFLNSESEYILEDDKEWFPKDDIFTVEEENQHNLTEVALWQAAKLSLEPT